MRLLQDFLEKLNDRITGVKERHCCGMKECACVRLTLCAVNGGCSRLFWFGIVVSFAFLGSPPASVATAGCLLLPQSGLSQLVFPLEVLCWPILRRRGSKFRAKLQHFLHGFLHCWVSPDGVVPDRWSGFLLFYRDERNETVGAARDGFFAFRKFRFSPLIAMSGTTRRITQSSKRQYQRRICHQLHAQERA